VSRIASAIGNSVESGVAEELCFRLVLFRLLWRVTGVWPALFISAALFGGVHLTNRDGTLVGALGVMVEGGLVSVALYAFTGRIWLSIGEHAGWNFAQGWILGASVSGSGGTFAGGPLRLQPAAGVPDYLSGGAFGPEASLAALFLTALIGAVALRAAWRRGRLSNIITETNTAPT
jgi:hypothetical protein